MSKATKYLDKILTDATERQRVQSNYERACAACNTQPIYNLAKNPPTTAEEFAEKIVDMGRQTYGVHLLISPGGDGITCTCHGECVVCQLTTGEKDRAGNWCHSYHLPPEEREESQS